MRDKSSIFVGNLAVFCNETDINSHFSTCGEITDVSIKCDPKTGRQLSYGFVRFAKEKYAKVALETMNGTMLCGRSLRVGKALKERSENDDGSSTSPFSIPSVHVSYKAFQVNKIVNEQSLRELYGQYGEVLDVTIKHATVDKDGNYQSGYGFIHYSSNETGVSSAFNAVKSLMDTVIDDVNYISKVSHALEKHLTSSGGGGHSSNESISSLDEDSWFELSTVDMNCNEPRQKTSERKQISGHRRISSADTLVNCFQYQQEATGEDYPTEYNIGIAQREEMNDDMEGEMDFDHCGTEANSDNCGGQQLYDMPSTPQRVAYPIMKSPMIVPVQIQPQYLSYQMSPQMVTQQMNSSPMMSPYYYQAQPMYQPIYVASQPPQMPILFPTIQSPYCYSPIAVQQQGNGHIGVTYNQMHQDMAEYSNNYHQSMQPQVYIPVACGYSSPSTMN